MQSSQDKEGKQTTMDVAKSLPMNLKALHLPNLQSRSERVPRRYEETKPVVVQDFTHRKICDIGNQLYLKTIQKCNTMTENAVREAERTTWIQAEILKKEAVSDAVSKEREAHERTIKKLQKIHEKHVKEEMQKIESNMQKMTIEQVQAERKAGEARLDVAVKQTEGRCHQELVKAVREARAEERLLASQEADRVARCISNPDGSLEAEKLAKLLHEANVDKEESLQKLMKEMQEEQDRSVAAARREEQATATEEIRELTMMFTNQINHLKQQVKGREQTIANQKVEIQKLEAETAQILSELHDARKSFQEFIDKSLLFDPGQSEYVIPPTSRPLTSKP